MDLEKVMVSGMLTPHYFSEKPVELIRSYVADYLKEEIPQFSEFLRMAALTSGELISYNNVAIETGVSSKIVRSYFDIFESTMLVFRIPSWKSSKTRRLITAEKFYLFDIGLSNYLSKDNRNRVSLNSENL